MRKTALLRLAVVGFAVAVVACAPPPRRVVVVRAGPPADVVETVPASLGPAYVWVKGHYRWDANAQGYAWAPGHWVVPPQGYHEWVAGHWVEQGGGWLWVEGHWN
jgi:hypothetical protein